MWGLWKDNMIYTFFLNFLYLSFWSWMNILSMGYIWFITLFLSSTFCSLIVLESWLRVWNLDEYMASLVYQKSMKNNGRSKKISMNQNFFLRLLSELRLTLCFVAISVCSSEVNLTVGALNAASKLHKLFLENLLRQPIQFFDCVPVGRIISRFSKDIRAIDEELPYNCYEFIESSCIVSLNILSFIVQLWSSYFWSVLIFFHAFVLVLPYSGYVFPFFLF